MCGITGCFDFSQQLSLSSLKDNIIQMTQTLVLRGPDSGGVWIDPAMGLALGHRRLAIRELTSMGNQPMLDKHGSVLIYNGEIFNAEELRQELITQGINFKGHSDTEVVLHGCAAWGVEALTKKLLGMFAFAFWDAPTQKLFLVRDRLGVKPLYWGIIKGVLLFGSELKALQQYFNWSGQLDLRALAGLLRHCYIPGPYSAYANISKLVPGHILVFSKQSPQHPQSLPHIPQDITYWNAQAEFIKATHERHQTDETTMLNQLHSLLLDAVKRRMISDVPLGSFLSGGIDSSLVTALMQAQSNIPVRTFSIGFSEKSYDEAPFAKAVAKHLGTNHTEYYLNPAEAIAQIPSLASVYDEPFADSSQLPTLLLSQITKQQVTVALSGDGGDELFAGYSRYPYTLQLLKCQPFVQKILSFIPESILNKLPKNRLPSFLASFLAKNPQAVYLSQMSHWQDPASLLQVAEYPSQLLNPELARGVPDFLEQMQFLDATNYLPDDILTKVDRASMACSLEVRVPLLDHRLVDFAWKIPLSSRLQKDRGKLLLRKVLKNYIPEELFERPKMGFGVPIDHWLRNQLRPWAEELLSPQAIKATGLLNIEPIQAIWQKHLAGENWQYLLWDVLMLQSWLELDNKPAQTTADGSELSITIEGS